MVLQDLAQAQVIIDALQDKLALANKPRKLTLKVTDGGKDGKGSRGAISCYGMGRFPITLYASQWERLLGASDEITSFIETNRSLLAVKA